MIKKYDPTLDPNYLDPNAVGEDRVDHAGVEHIEKLARLMDSQFIIPGTSFKLGLDTIIGLIPGIGDTIGLAVAGYIVAQSARIGVQKRILVQMLYNIFIDWLIGLVPIIGDLFDMGWKGNNRNAALLRRSIERNASHKRSS